MALVLDMPVELGPDFMGVVRLRLADAEREPGDHPICFSLACESDEMRNPRGLLAVAGLTDRPQ